MKSLSASVLLAFLVFVSAKRTEADVVEAALVGGVIGGAIGMAIAILGSGAGDSSITNPDSSFLADSLRLPAEFTFTIVDDSASFAKIRYSYTKILSDYESYAGDKRKLDDTVTRGLLAKQFEALGGVRQDDSLAQWKVSYVQQLGWDMGEIVKSMMVCVEGGPTDSKAASTVCASFSERTMLNTHPTRTGIVKNLVQILLGNRETAKLNPKKFRRYTVTRS